ncbi:MAG: GNAT family N-acetyltransferase [Thermoplasmata archaeon]
MPDPEIWRHRPRVRPALTSDIPRILEILTDAAEWARQRGVERWWPIPFPSGRIVPPVDRKEAYVGEIEGKVVGFFVLTWADPAIWGDVPPDAGYVHLLAAERDPALRGLGRHLLGWAEERVRAAGRAKLRLDCIADNASLVRYYESVGFVRVRVVPSPVLGEVRSIQLFERDLGDRDPGPA